MRPLSPAVSALAGALLVSQGAWAGECKPVDTTITTTFFVDGCESPVGICTAGTIPSGPLQGTTRFVALTVQEGPNPDITVYTGELVITTRKGTLTIRDAGVLNGAAGTFVELQNVVDGSRGLGHLTGLLTSRGVMTATGFQGSLRGFVCNVHAFKGIEGPDRDDRG